jgi:hypothetical protein
MSPVPITVASEVTEHGEAFGALDEQRVPGTREAVGGHPLGGPVACGEEAAPDERAQVRLEPGAADPRIPALEGPGDPRGVTALAVAFAAGDGLETVALEGGELDPRASAVFRWVVRE